MAANIDDKLSANYNNGVPRVASVVANRVAEDGTLQCDGLAGWSTDTPVHFTAFTRSTDQFGNPSVTNQQWFKGVVSGDSITQLKKYDGLQDIGNIAGDVVEPMVTAGYLKDLVSAVLVSLASDGKLRADAVAGVFKNQPEDSEEDSPLDDIIKARNIADGSILPQKLDMSDAETLSQNFQFPIPTTQKNVELLVGKVNKGTNATPNWVDVYFQAKTMAIPGANPFAIDISGVNTYLKYYLTMGTQPLPLRTASNWFAYDPSTNSRPQFMRDAAGSWQGSTVTLWVWYTKSQ